MKIYIPICDIYINGIEALKYTIDKYWSKDLDITLLGYQKPKYDIGNWKFISLGTDRGPEYFSEDMYNFFNKIDDKFFIYLTEDWLILKKVNVELLDILIDQLDDNVGRIGLTKDIECRIVYSASTSTTYEGYIHVDTINNYEIIELKYNANYRISLLASIWNREYFLMNLIDKHSPWSFEAEQSEKAMNDNYRILGSKDEYVLNFCHLYHRGKLRDEWTQSAFKNSASKIEFLSDEDIINIQNLIKII